jgi:hypothetical protein
MQPKQGPKQPRSQQDYELMSRSHLVNHYKTEVNKSEGKPLPYKITDFLTKRIWSWLYYYLDSRFGKNHPYATYRGEDSGIYQLDPSSADGGISLAVAADWATYTKESMRIASEIEKQDPDYTIHLGDTYYVGAPFEVAANFLDEGAPWVRGRKGSFGLLGNHEMYARGIAFFDKLMPTLGIRKADGSFGGQQAPFFCLENDHWRILGLDTGYHSTGVPLLEMTRYFRPDCRFDKLLIQWLTEKVHLGDPSDKRGLLILTHHQYYSAFKSEDEYPFPAKQLASLLGSQRPVIWIWGHEHKLAIYGKTKIGDSLTAYGRCIGHGGMPVEVSSAAFTPSADMSGYPTLVAVDTRIRPTDDHLSLGYNGYVMLRLQQETLCIEYRDRERLLLTERWEAEDGSIRGAVEVPADCPLKPLKPWQDAVN